MFCPRCSEAQISEDVRFCKRCGLRLEVVHALVSEEATSASRPESFLPKQKDISIGAALMFIGSVVAMLWAVAHRGGDADVLPQVYLILGFTLGFILLLFHPLLGGLKKLFSETKEGSAGEGTTEDKRTTQRNGINLGALLMFLGTIKAMALSTLKPDLLQRPLVTIEIATAMFLMLLVVRWLIAGVYRSFFGSSAAPKGTEERVTAELQQGFRERSPALPAAQHDAFIPLQKNAESVEMAQPVSVTENTTGLLNRK